MLKKVVLVTAAAGLLSACAERWDVESARLTANSGSEYEKALQKEFADLAEVQKAQSDWDDVEFFAQKARAVAAAAQNATQPSAYNSRPLQDSFTPEAMQMRAALMEKINAGAAKSSPAALAKMQVAGYECWLEEAQVGVRSTALDACRTAFDAGLKSFETLKPAAPNAAAAAVAPDATPFIVLFKPNSSVIDAVGASVIDAAAKAYGEKKPVTVIVTGHTDSVGSANSNIILSQKRAEVVAGALSKKGVSSSSMSLEAYGEEKPKVTNGDIADEAVNRRVEILLKK